MAVIVVLGTDLARIVGHTAFHYGMAVACCKPPGIGRHDRCRKNAAEGGLGGPAPSVSEAWGAERPAKPRRVARRPSGVDPV